MMVARPRYSLRWLTFAIGVPARRLKVLALTAEQRYHTFENKKGRLIDNPSDELKEVQRQIRQRMLVPLPLPDHVHGCVSGRSAFSAAAKHVGKRGLASVDIRKCYPSITSGMVFTFFRSTLGLGSNLAGLLTRLTTKGGHLPTGAPTSDALANLILKPVDQEIARIAEQLGLSFTRYVDNIDFSGDESRAAIGPAIQALRSRGFSVRHEKVFNAGPGARHVATGLNVNGQRPSLGRAHRDRVRAACHQVILAAGSGQPIEHMVPTLRGRLGHIRTTNPGEAERLRKMLERAGVSL